MANRKSQFGSGLNNVVGTDESAENSGFRRSSPSKPLSPSTRIQAVRLPNSDRDPATGYSLVAERILGVKADVDDAVDGTVFINEEPSSSKAFAERVGAVKSKPQIQRIRGLLICDRDFFSDENFSVKAEVAEELAKLICVGLAGPGSYETWAPLVEDFVRKINARSFARWLKSKRFEYNIGPSGNTPPWRAVAPLDDSILQWTVFSPSSRAEMNLHLLYILKGLDL